MFNAKGDLHQVISQNAAETLTCYPRPQGFGSPSLKPWPSSTGGELVCWCAPEWNMWISSFLDWKDCGWFGICLWTTDFFPSDISRTRPHIVSWPTSILTWASWPRPSLPRDLGMSWNDLRGLKRIHWGLGAGVVSVRVSGVGRKYWWDFGCLPTCRRCGVVLWGGMEGLKMSQMQINSDPQDWRRRWAPPKK